MMGLVPSPGKILSGDIFLHDKNLTKNTKEEWRKLRGKEISMIFQDPMTALNPAYSVGEQIREVLKTHRNDKFNLFYQRKRKKEEVEKVIQLMEEVKIPSARERYDDYPHQFSGGMQQRILVAMALACEPKIILADEPTTALDVTIQAQILDVLKNINQKHQTSILLVTHDLSVASEFCDEIVVMYAGRIVEKGPTRQVIDHPKHPYTKGLLNSIPVISEKKRKIQPIKGNVIDLEDLGEGCGFYNRCPFATPLCKEKIPMIQTDGNREVRCLLYDEVYAKETPIS
jgi:oligopeptide/dipeptide ABC transporter ATP-binding protein